MRKVETFYTVLLDKKGFPVKYCGPTIYKVITFAGPFNDPGEASQEFKASVGGAESCYLEPQQFQTKARALAQLRREAKQEQELLNTWNRAAMGTVRV